MEIYKTYNDIFGFIGILDTTENVQRNGTTHQLQKGSIIFLLSKGKYIDYNGAQSLYWKLYVPSLKRVLYYVCYENNIIDLKRSIKPLEGQQ